MAKGQKSCPTCNESCGPRTKLCPGCKHDFFHTQTALAAAKAEITGDKGDIVINVPGKRKNEPGEFCPVAPGHLFDEVFIKKWAIDMLNHRFDYCGKLARYSKEAVKYFVEGYWPEYIRGELNPDYAKVCNIIEELPE